MNITLSYCQKNLPGFAPIECIFVNVQGCTSQASHCSAVSKSRKAGQNLKASFDLPKKWYSGVFEVTNYKSVRKTSVNKMADPIWRTYMYTRWQNSSTVGIWGF